MHAAQLLLIAGLPGCGKSTYLAKLAAEEWAPFDDFKNRAHRNSRCFRESRHYTTLTAFFAEGRRCAVADIDFCRTAARSEAESVLEEDCPVGRFRWCYFAKDLAACEASIRRRNRESLENDLRELFRYSELYEIPEGVVPLPCVGSVEASDGRSVKPDESV
jgi:hypothetical protein